MDVLRGIQQAAASLASAADLHGQQMGMAVGAMGDAAQQTDDSAWQRFVDHAWADVCGCLSLVACPLRSLSLSQET